jgi:hypothetical protein
MPDDHNLKMHYRFTTAPPLVYPESDKSDLRPHTFFLEDPVDRISAQVSRMVFSLKIIRPEHCILIYHIRATLRSLGYLDVIALIFQITKFLILLFCFSLKPTSCRTK